MKTAGGGYGLKPDVGKTGTRFSVRFRRMAIFRHFHRDGEMSAMTKKHLTLILIAVAVLSPLLSYLGSHAFFEWGGNTALRWCIYLVRFFILLAVLVVPAYLICKRGSAAGWKRLILVLTAVAVFCPLLACVVSHAFFGEGVNTVLRLSICLVEILILGSGLFAAVAVPANLASERGSITGQKRLNITLIALALLCPYFFYLGIFIGLVYFDKDGMALLAALPVYGSGPIGTAAALTFLVTNIKHFKKTENRPALLLLLVSLFINICHIVTFSRFFKMFYIDVRSLGPIFQIFW